MLSRTVNTCGYRWKTFQATKVDYLTATGFVGKTDAS